MTFLSSFLSLWRLFVEKYMMMTIIVTVFLVTGTANTILSKTSYQLQAEGSGGNVHYFEKPLFLNWAMFLGMTLCLIPYVMKYYLLPLFTKKMPTREVMKLKGYLLVLIPSFCDFAATYLMNFGLLFVSSSVFQMMRGSILVFTAILAVFYRKQKMHLYEIIGVVIIVISLILIGSAAFLPGAQEDVQHGSTSSEDSSSTSWYYTLIGITLVLIAQFLQGFQTILEEQFLHDIKAPVEFIVGLEGIYGLVICSIMMPIMSLSFWPDSLKEDTKDTFIMLANSVPLILITIGYVFSILVFNIVGMIITDWVNAMVRNVLDPLRMITTWICSVFLYYVVDEAIGEKVGWFTLLEVFGFIVLTVGILLYTKVIKLPWFKYEVSEDVEPLNSSPTSEDNDENQKEEQNQAENDISMSPSPIPGYVGNEKSPEKVGEDVSLLKQ
ncbi:hypothetical protein EIN_467230 [Entamoeba invadens IP1]|uniref:EamA domain-containing protein n=1 Tax=Entamoeba invadens IP1 TaxID=370355 RepID=A0A0A1TUG9_ENTIV|nr:hypothetical protein EIN_467230 [Entamoeba invadens IP1]ELP83659.1 hypothetical protein EIN_467230 [Entamoeba invadens IP1]|eukprot:XP_004183005.1 hypothetical protein EIN_467230 [Entamoeba invadens IP1]